MSPGKTDASAISSLVVIFLFRVWLYRTRCAWNGYSAYVCTFCYSIYNFCSGGVVNPFNLIDGLNGLSSYVAISVAFSLSIVAFHAGIQISIFLILVIASVLGFMT